MIQIVFLSIVTIALFIYTFIYLVKENNTNYVYVLALEFLGLIIEFISIIRAKGPDIILSLFILIISIILPIIYFILEHKNIHIDELINISKSKKNKENLKKYLLKNVEKYPNSYKSHKMLAKYYEENGEKEKAEDEYMMVIRINPKDYEIYCDLAKLFHENKKEQDAKNLLQDLLNQKPDYYKASILLGNILYDNEEYKEAILVYNEALRYSPAEYYLYYCLGMTYTRLNDFQNAKEYYMKAAKINSLKDISSLNLGQIYLIFREYEEAEKYFYECLNSEDEKIQANSYLYLAKINLLKNNTEKAIIYANMSIEIYPEIVKKIENDDTFGIIIGKIKRKPSKEVKTKLNEKEINIIEHLGKTYNLVENLADNMKIETIEKEIEKN